MLNGALALLALAMPASEAPIHTVNMGPGDIPMGTYCRVQDVCLVAQSDADCGKINGQTFETLEACKSPAPAAVPEKNQ